VALLAGSIGLAAAATVYLQQRQAQTRRLEVAWREVILLRGQAQADPEEDPVKWHAALQAVKRAEDLLGPLIDAASQRRVRELGDQVPNATQAAKRDAKLLREVVDIRLAEADDRDGSASDASYAQAFRDAELDMDELGPEAAGAKIKARPEGVVLALAAALDDWAARRRTARPKDADAWKQLVAAARVADPEPTRDRLRQLWSEPDRKAQREPLLKLAQEADPRGWPPASLILLAGALADAGERDAAADLLRRSQAEHPGDVWVNYDLARLLEQFHPPRTEEAIRFYSVARALRPETAHELAHALEGRGRGDEAVVVFRDLTRLRSGNGRHWSCLGKLLRDRGDRAGSEAALGEAIAASRAAIQSQPDAAAAHFSLGNALRQRGQLAEAIAEYRAVIRLKPDFALAHTFLGGILCDAMHDYGAAVAEFRAAIRLKPDDDQPHYNLGVALYRQGKVDEAIAAYREAIRLKPNYANAHTNLGAALSRQGNLTEAIAEHREAIRLKADHPEAHANLGLSLRTLGEFAAAVEELRKARDLARNNSSSPRISSAN
jgi:tetratricopeptide (TPR) repeat protein